MKKLFITIFVLAQMFAFVILTDAQEVKIVAKPYTYTTQVEAIGKADKTTQWVTIKGVQHPLYLTERGSHFYIITNKQGEYVRRYVKVD